MVESDKSIKCRDCGEEFVFTAVGKDRSNYLGFHQQSTSI